MAALPFGVKQNVGQRPYQEDCFRVDSDALSAFGLQYYAVFDGHGGPNVAQYCADHMHKRLAFFLAELLGNHQHGPLNANGAAFDNAVRHALVSAFHDMHEGVKAMARAESEETDAHYSGLSFLAKRQWNGGSTAVVAVVGPTRVWLAHAGDSRAVVSANGKLAAATDDHSPARHAAERRRILNHGGLIEENRFGIQRVGGRYGLSMTRAIGDDDYAGQGLIPTPDITVVRRQAGASMHMIIASDGLWDTVETEDAIAVLEKVKQRVAQKGVTNATMTARIAASVLDKKAIDAKSTDNITVLVVDISRST